MRRPQLRDVRQQLRLPAQRLGIRLKNQWQVLKLLQQLHL